MYVSVYIHTYTRIHMYVYTCSNIICMLRMHVIIRAGSHSTFSIYTVIGHVNELYLLNELDIATENSYLLQVSIVHSSGLYM
jgi:Mg2+/Co2+ transporter CorB